MRVEWTGPQIYMAYAYNCCSFGALAVCRRTTKLATMLARGFETIQDRRDYSPAIRISDWDGSTEVDTTFREHSLSHDMSASLPKPRVETYIEKI